MSWRLCWNKQELGLMTSQLSKKVTTLKLCWFMQYNTLSLFLQLSSCLTKAQILELRTSKGWPPSTMHVYMVIGIKTCRQTRSSGSSSFSVRDSKFSKRWSRHALNKVKLRSWQHAIVWTSRSFSFVPYLAWTLLIKTTLENPFYNMPRKLIRQQTASALT